MDSQINFIKDRKIREIKQKIWTWNFDFLSYRNTDLIPKKEIWLGYGLYHIDRRNNWSHSYKFIYVKFYILEEKYTAWPWNTCLLKPSIPISESPLGARIPISMSVFLEVCPLASSTYESWSQAKFDKLKACEFSETSCNIVLAHNPTINGDLQLHN